MMTASARRLAFKPLANLFAIILVVGFNAMHATASHVLLLSIFMAYVAASQFTPRYANARKAARRLL